MERQILLSGSASFHLFPVCSEDCRVSTLLFESVHKSREIKGLHVSSHFPKIQFVQHAFPLLTVCSEHLESMNKHTGIV